MQRRIESGSVVLGRRLVVTVLSVSMIGACTPGGDGDVFERLEDEDESEGARPEGADPLTTSLEGVARVAGFDVTIVLAGADIDLNWTSVGAGFDYDVWRSTEPYFSPGDPGSIELVNGVVGTSFTDAGGNDTTSYYYRVEAEDGASAYDSTIVGKYVQPMEATGYSVLGFPLLETGNLDAASLGMDIPGVTEVWRFNPHQRFYTPIHPAPPWAAPNFFWNAGDAVVVLADGSSPTTYTQAGYLPQDMDIDQLMLSAGLGSTVVTVSDSLQRIWAFAAGGPDRSGELWLGTIPGGLFRSCDRGDSWERVESLWNHPDRTKWFGGGADAPGIHSILVDPRDSKRVLVAVSCGGVWETLDDGATWTVRAEGMRADFMPPERANDPVIQDPHLVVACSADFDRLWAQHHCGIWKSTDGARSWTEVKEAGPSTFGFAVAVHPKNPGTAWFVPAVSDQHRIPVDGRLVVTRTRDGGASFDVLTEGLPQEHAYDLVYRHALDIDASGERLAFGSTTGGVWVSENGGDLWSAVSLHLPPVYAVCFA